MLKTVHIGNYLLILGESREGPSLVQRDTDGVRLRQITVISSLRMLFKSLERKKSLV
jgi:hypothetical protein